jgi:nitrate/nitrite sensing protein/HAAS domain-containing protein
MSGTVLDHRLVRGYLRELDAVMRGLPAAQARELREQITAHLDDALGPDAGDYEVAATLSRLGSPADLAAEAGAASGSSGPRPALSGWRLATIIAVPAVIAALFGGQHISTDASNAATFGRDQHLAQLNAAVVRLTQNLEDERDLSAGYLARGAAGPVPVTLADARTATNAAVRAVQADAAGVGAGYQPGTVQDLESLLARLTDLGEIRTTMSSRAWPASQVIQVYTDNVIGPAITFSAAVGVGTDDTRLQGTVTTLAALLAVENELSVQRAVLYAALSTQPPRLLPVDLTSLSQAFQQQQADLTTFTASADTAEQQFFLNTVSGSAVDRASAQETLAEAAATAKPSAPLTRNTGLDAATWYGNMSTTIDDTRQVADQAAGQVTARADTLKSNATKRLLVTSIITLLLLVLLLVTALARPLRKLVQ